jgi:alpha-ketoglutaric semialdehyde dehydrogenase
VSTVETRVAGNFVGGRWVSADADYATTDPAHPGLVVGRYASSGPADVEAAVTAAAEAFPAWRATPAPERAGYVSALVDGLIARRDELADAITREMGKPRRESLGEIDRSVAELRFIAGEAFRATGEVVPSARRDVRAHTRREPIGVIAAITPWNFPVTAPLRKIGPALVYGCTVVLKPAVQTPAAAVILMEILDAAGLPAGVVNMVTGPGASVGEALSRDPRVAGISFTGSTQVGLSVAVTAAARNARVQLEMGGKNAAVVAGYADLAEAAAQIVPAAFQASGQRCTSISRVIVLRSQAAALEEALVAEVAKLVPGDGFDPATTLGPLATSEQVEKCTRYVALAREAGGRVLTGGSPLEGAFHEATVITDVAPGSPAAVEEIFGPVLVVVPVDDVEEAIAVHDEVRYGLTAAVFTDDADLAERLVDTARTGMVHVNHGTISEAHLPFGGVKDSGAGGFSIGATNAEFFSVMKTVYVRHRR